MEAGKKSGGLEAYMMVTIVNTEDRIAVGPVPGASRQAQL